MINEITQFTPPNRILMGPGPSDVHPRVLQAMARPTVGHLDPSFVGLMDEIKELLRYVFQTENQLTLPVSAPGSAGMETCFVNLIEPGDTVVVCQNGVFGGRMKENVERCGGTAVMVEDEWGHAIDLNKVEDALKANPGTKALAFVHAETSTGVLSDARTLCEMAQKHGALSIVDAVTSLGGSPVMVDEWGADAVYSGTQKCLSCPPGLSPVTFSDKAVQVTLDRKTPVQSWLLDLSLVAAYWQGDEKSGARTYHHTAPVNALMGLHEALRRIVQEGLENVWARHKAASDIIVAGMEEMGFSMLVDADIRLPELLTIMLPEGIDDGAVRGKLLNDHGIEISAGLGPFAGKLWRIGVMGEGARPENAERVLSAIKECIA